MSTQLFEIPETWQLRELTDSELLEFHTDLLAAIADVEGHIADVKSRGQQVFGSIMYRAKRYKETVPVIRSLLVERGIGEFAPVQALTASSLAELLARQQHTMARFGALWLAAEAYLGDENEDDGIWQRFTGAVEELRPYMTGPKR